MVDGESDSVDTDGEARDETTLRDAATTDDGDEENVNPPMLVDGVVEEVGTDEALVDMVVLALFGAVSAATTAGSLLAAEDDTETASAMNAATLEAKG